jgi:hypothetical protein
LQCGAALQAIEPAIELWIVELAHDAKGALLEQMVELLAALECLPLSVGDGKRSAIENFGLVAARALLEEAEVALRNDDRRWEFGGVGFWFWVWFWVWFRSGGSGQ